MQPRLLRPALQALALVLATGCGDTTGPSGRGSTPVDALPATVGDTITVRPAASDTVVYYRLTPSAHTEVAIFAATEGAPARFDLLQGDSLVLIDGIVPAPGAALLALRSSVIQLYADNTYYIRVRPLQPGAATRVRFLIYQVNRAPEHHSATAAIEEAISNETLETSADIDEFTIAGLAGQELIAFLQALDPSLEDLAALLVAVPLPGFDRFVRAGGGDPEAAASGRFTVASDGVVRLTLSVAANNWKPGPTNAGAVRLSVRAINRAPEQGGSAVALGDTIAAESIDFVGDVDRYTVQAPAGSQVNVFFQAVNDTATSLLQTYNVADPFSRVESKGTDETLTTQAIGRLQVPTNGVLTLEVAGQSDMVGLHRGAYRLFVYPVNRGPEVAGSAVTLGQAINGETIELPGDLDEFTLNVPQKTLANFVLTGIAPGGIQLFRTAPGSNVPLNHVALFPGNSTQVGAEVAGGAGTFMLEAGTYTLSVDGLTSRGDGYRGAYGVQTFAIDSLPETAPATLTIESSAFEVLTPVGDRDIYMLSSNAPLDLTLIATGGPATGIQAFVRGIGGLPIAGVVGAAAGGPPNHSGRIDLPGTGPYELFVGPINDGTKVSEVGAYQLSVLRHPTSPEHVSSTLTTNVEVTSEGLDSPGDVDDFTLSAAPGSEIQVLFKKGTVNSGFVQVLVSDATTGSELDGMASAGFNQATGRVTVPAGGSLRLRFSEPRFSGCFSVDCAFNVVDSYRFTPVLISRLPETGGSALSFDVITEEAIEPVGDVDEFTFSGTAGQVVNVYFQSVTLLGSPGDLQVLRPGGAVVGSAQVGNPTDDIRTVGTGPITLPVTGTYRIRILGQSDQEGSGTYRILLE